jgi:fluoride exporter
VQSLLLVFLGGGLGSVLRYGAGLAAARWAGPFTATGGWPWGTFAVNVIGCTLMGVMFRLLPMPMEGGPQARLLFMTGVLGGFTTFSAFALDAALLWMRQDQAGFALYVTGSVLTSLLGVALGLAIGKAISP